MTLQLDLKLNLSKSTRARPALDPRLCAGCARAVRGAAAGRARVQYNACAGSARVRYDAGQESEHALTGCNG